VRAHCQHVPFVVREMRRNWPIFLLTLVLTLADTSGTKCFLHREFSLPLSLIGKNLLTVQLRNELSATVIGVGSPQGGWNAK